MAASDGSIRASDADRERVAASLRDHYAAGRLTSDEFNERLDKTYAATTLGDLAGLQTDLPAPPDPGQFPVPDPNQVPTPTQSPGPIMAGPGRLPEHWRGPVGSWLSISLVCFVIWLLSGASGSLWFLWPTGVLGALLLARLVSGAPPPGSRRQYRRDYRRQRRRY
jgi:hypothetical protein